MKGLRAHWTLRRWLSAYLDGELTGDLLERVREHLVSCQSCQRDLEDIRKGRGLLLHPESLPTPGPSTSSRSPLRRFLAIRWASVAVLALAIIAASVWWSLPSVHAMDIGFYTTQFQMTDRCAYPCTSLVETTVAELRRSAPFAVRYPGWLPPGMVLQRAVRYRTPKAEGVGLIFTGRGKGLAIFQQPRKLGVQTAGQHTSLTMLCGQKCTMIKGDRVQLFQWTAGDFCFVVATTVPRGEVEAVVNSLGNLPE